MVGFAAMPDKAPRISPPLNSFAPELKQAWVKGASEIVTIKVPSRQAAISLRQRLYKLREALRAAQDPLYENIQYSHIFVEPAEECWLVLIVPPDGNYLASLREALCDRSNTIEKTACGLADDDGDAK
jgi:hypothetical protein